MYKHCIESINKNSVPRKQSRPIRKYYRRDDSLLGAIQGAPAAALTSSLLYDIVLIEVTCQFTGKEISYKECSFLFEHDPSCSRTTICSEEWRKEPVAQYGTKNFHFWRNNLFLPKLLLTDLIGSTDRFDWLQFLRARQEVHKFL